MSRRRNSRRWWSRNSWSRFWCVLLTLVIHASMAIQLFTYFTMLKHIQSPGAEIWICDPHKNLCAPHEVQTRNLKSQNTAESALPMEGLQSNPFEGHKPNSTLLPSSKDIPPVNKTWLDLRKTLLAETPVRKVLLYGLARRISEPLGEILSEDSRITYWPQALPPLYSSLYSISGPSGNISSHKPGTLNIANYRTVSKWERDKLVTYIQDLTSCSLSRLPREVWLSPGAGGILKEFRSCWVSSCMRDWGDLARCHYNVCRHKSGTSRWCGDTVTSAVTNQCASILPEIRGRLPALISNKDKWDLHSRMMKKTNMQFTDKDMQKMLASFTKHEQCIVDLTKYVEPCKRKAHVVSKCTDRTIHVINIEGLPTDGIEALIKVMPDIYILHSLSHTQDCSELKGAFRESCIEEQPMAQKLNVLSKVYPGVIQQLLYQDIPHKPNQYLAQLYSHLNVNIPDKLMDTFVKRVTILSSEILA